MKHQSIYAIARSEAQATRIIDRLTGFGFIADDISVVFPEGSSPYGTIYQRPDKTLEGSPPGAATGGLICSALGLLVGIGTLAIPWAGPLIAAGPLLGAFSSRTISSSASGISGGLIGLGIPEFEAMHYEDRISGGNILISVHAETKDEVKQARAILEKSGAEDVSVTSLGDIAESVVLS